MLEGIKDYIFREDGVYSLLNNRYKCPHKNYSLSSITGTARILDTKTGNKSFSTPLLLCKVKLKNLYASRKCMDRWVSSTRIRLDSDINYRELLIYQ